MEKAQYKAEKKQLDGEFYDTKIKRLGIRNQIEAQRLDTTQVRLETVQELHTQANDRLQATQGMTMLMQENHLARANRLIANTAKLKAGTQELLDDTAYLFGEGAKTQLQG